MPKSTTFLGSLLVNIKTVSESYDLDWQELFVEAGISPDLESSDRIPSEKLGNVMKLVSKKTNDPCIGLELGRYPKPAAFHAIGFSVIVSGTLKEALDKFTRFHRMLTDASEFIIEENLTEYKLKIKLLCDQNGRPILVEENVDMVLASITSLCRELHSHDLAPLRVTLKRSAIQPERYFQFYNAPVEFSAGEDSITFDKDILNERLPGANIELARLNDRIVVEYLASFDKGGLLDLVYSKVVELLPLGEPTLGSVAESLGMNSRTLQYRLNKENTYFKRILDETRKELALQYIQDPKLSITEITFLLGFSNSSNFNRTFKRWTGLSPSNYRASQ